MSHEPQVCPHCESDDVTEEMTLHRFPYGVTSVVELSATIPMMTCNHCGLQWSDYRAEDLIQAAVDAHRVTQP